MRVNKHTTAIGAQIKSSRYGFGIDNPDIEDVRKATLLSEGGGVGLVSIESPYERDLSIEDAKGIIVAMEKAIKACDVFNETIEKYLKLEE